MRSKHEPEVRLLAAPPLERAIAELAGRQHGVVSLPQLRALGLGTRAVQKRVAAGRLHRIHRGVYAVGHARLVPDGYAMAAVLACGPGAVLSHRSAAALWSIRRNARARHDVTTTSRRRVTGVDVHTTRALDREDVTTIRGIPVTIVARTIVDLADSLPLDALAAVLHEAEVQRLFDRAAIESTMTRANGRRGLKALKQALGEPNPGERRNDFEEAFLTLCRHAGLPLPEMNADLHLDGRPINVDGLWREHKVAIELDGEEVHRTRKAFHADRRRDTALAAHGYVTGRYTHHRVTRERLDTAAELQRILAVRSWPPWRSPSTSA